MKTQYVGGFANGPSNGISRALAGISAIRLVNKIPICRSFTVCTYGSARGAVSNGHPYRDLLSSYYRGRKSTLVRHGYSAEYNKTTTPTDINSRSSAV